MVKWGEAMWVVVERTWRLYTKVCSLCGGDEKLIKACIFCNATGKENKKIYDEKYNNDIVLIKHRTKSNRPSTPRVPTIESEHIERAYVECNKEAAERIEEYGLLILEARAFPGPKRCHHDPKLKCIRCALPEAVQEALKDQKLYAIGVEPEDNPVTREGRKYDWGRAI
jgi:hypothetical protein